MIYIGWGILFIGTLRLLIAFANWATKLYLPQESQTGQNPFVSILVPARNEESNIGNLLTDLSTFDYEPLEIIVYNDNSTDNTAEIVRHYALKNPKIKLINGTEPDKNWLGKNFACHSLAGVAQGEKLLFLDADVRVKNGLIEKAVSYMEKRHLKLLSIFPKQLMPTRETQLAVPIMNWILLSLLPLIMVRLSGWKSFSAANGQFMLFDAKSYKELHPHKLFRQNKAEDIAILHFFKKQKIKVATLLGNDDIRCTMYNNLQEAIDGFSKNIFQFFGGSIAITFAFAFFTTFAPVYLLIFNELWIFATYLISIVLIRIFTSLASKQSVTSNVIHMLPQHVVFLRIIFEAYHQQKNKTIIWKDRNISLQD